MFDILFTLLEGVKRKVSVYISQNFPRIPPEVTQGVNGFIAVVEQIKAVSYVVPIASIGIAIGIVSAGIVGGIFIKFTRIGASFVTLGGGAA